MDGFVFQGRSDSQVSEMRKNYSSITIVLGKIEAIHWY